MAKQSEGRPKRDEESEDEGGRIERAKDAAKTTGKKINAILWWVIPIALALWGIIKIFGGGETPQALREPDSALLDYGEIVRPYTPPTDYAPSSTMISDWLDYFDGPSQRWFNDNVNKLSYMRARMVQQDWKSMSEGQRRAAAMVYLLAQGPLRGPANILSKRIDEESGTALVRIATGGVEYDVTMLLNGRRWVIRDVMGQREALDQKLAEVRLPR